MANLITHKCLVPITHCLVLILVLGHVNSYRLNSVEEEDSSDSLKSLQSKLDAILDTESHEKKLLESLLFENERNEHPIHAQHTPSPASAPPPLQLSPASVESIVQRLVENSQRMESMIGMLTDFRTLLSQTISVQEKQLGYKTEVIELREETNYLREEIQKMKVQQAATATAATGSGSAYQNKIHNDETTINWLKESVKELRHEIVEVSSSLNVTGLLHLQQQQKLQEKSVARDVKGLQRRIETLQLNSDQMTEQLLEIQGEVADVRSWQGKMGQKLSQNSLMSTKPDTIYDRRRLKQLQENLEVESNEISEIHKKNNKKNAGAPAMARATRHSRKQLKTELHKVEKLMLEMVKEQNELKWKVEQLETGAEHGGAVWKQVLANGNGNDDGLVTITYSEDDNNVNDYDLDSDSKAKKRRRSKREERGPLTAAIQQRLSALESSLTDYANSLDLMDNKVGGLSELHATTTSLFTSLEAIESKYDLKITDLQSSLAKMEAGMSGVRVATDELKEQQNLQTKSTQTCKKDTRALSQTVQTTQLRVASLQNQILSWGLKWCADSNAEAIQNLQNV